MGIAERKQLEKHARRQLILESAAEIFHQKDFARATMEDIAERAQIAVGTIYLYFKSKADIYFSLTKPALEKLSNRLMRIADDIDSETDVKIKKIMYMLDDFYIRNRDAYYLITHTKVADYANLFPEENLKSLNELMRTNLRQMEIVIEEGIRKGIYRSVNPYSGAVVFWSAFMGINLFQENRLLPGKKDYRKATLDAFIEAMVAGLKK